MTKRLGKPESPCCGAPSNTSIMEDITLSHLDAQTLTSQIAIEIFRFAKIAPPLYGEFYA